LKVVNARGGLSDAGPAFMHIDKIGDASRLCFKSSSHPLRPNRLQRIHKL
jgi:hypothetical protein